MNLNQVTIPSLNVEKTVEFYKSLDLELIVEAFPRYARFECPTGNTTFSIHLVVKLPKENGVILYFEVDNVTEKVEKLQQKGIVFDSLAEDKSWLWKEASLKDPDGNQLLIYHAGENRKNPPWRIQSSKKPVSTNTLEIERKFLVLSEDFKKEAFKKTRIVQGFLNTNKLRTVRVRVKGEKGFITVKGISNKEGTTRLEWEKEIPSAEAEILLNLCEPKRIEKIRYEVKVTNHIFEIDVFEGENTGLIIAEIELTSENENFIKPNWLGKEVTGDVRYYNSQLSKVPYRNWGV